jgi:F0F1-type ATP synthase alpha subunit
MKWLIDNNMLTYSYYIFTEKTFILENQFDFNILQTKDLKISRITQYITLINDETLININKMLETINVHNNNSYINLCEDCNFVVRNDSVNKLYEYIKICLTKIPYETNLYEKILGRIIDEIQLNDYYISGVRVYDGYWNNNRCFVKNSE